MPNRPEPSRSRFSPRLATDLSDAGPLVLRPTGTAAISANRVPIPYGGAIAAAHIVVIPSNFSW
jgi:hypothetical protein